MVVTLALGGALFATGNTMLWLPLLGAVIRVFGKPEPGQHDLVVTATFVALIAALTATATT